MPSHDRSQALVDPQPRVAARFPAPEGGRVLDAVNLILLGCASLLLALSPLGNTPFELSQALLMLALLYSLALLDLLTQWVDSPLVVAGLALHLGALALFRKSELAEAVTGMFIGAGAFYLVGYVYETLRDRQGLGDGDPALMALVGAFVGWPNLAAVTLVSAALGLLVGYPVLRARGAPLTTPIPFGPFLCLGGMTVYLAVRLGLPWL